MSPYPSSPQRGTLGRRVIGFTGAALAFLWLDLALGHLSAGLKHPAMWVPLVWLPCATGLALLAALHPTPTTRRCFRVGCQMTLALGLMGFGFHVTRLMRDLKGPVQWGVLMRLMRYPPVFAPLAVSGAGLLGLLAMEE